MNTQDETMEEGYDDTYQEYKDNFGLTGLQMPEMDIEIPSLGFTNF